MTRNPNTAPQGRSNETLAVITRIAAGAVSGAVRALVTWLLDH
ncbi:hypothetical protein AB0K89_11260 [Streptomyces cinnamoneus]